MIDHVLKYILTYARKQVKSDNEHQYHHVPKSVETSHQSK